MQVNKPHYLGHRKRLREKFLKVGAEGLFPYEIIELILMYAIPRRDTKGIAKELLNKFGSIGKILDAEEKELMEIKGINEATIALIKLIKDVGAIYLLEKMKHTNILNSPKLVVDFAKMKISGLKDEQFMSIYLNTKNEVINYEIIEKGTIDRATIYPRKLVELALANRASSVIIVHNHPGGDITPSTADKEITKIIYNALDAVEIKLLDHIIITKNSYFSFREKNLL